MKKSAGVMTDTPLKERIDEILDLLEAKYGASAFEPRYDPITVLVQTILSQNTSDANSGEAFRSLLASFKSWEDVAGADVDIISHHIRSGGLGRIKALRIKGTLGEVVRIRGGLELDFLRQLSWTDAQDWLLKLPGVGLKTARCVLLFSLGMPALPVDTHIFRVTRRLGLISTGASLESAHRLLGEVVPPEDVLQFHFLVIEHGRRICQARRPRCQLCVLREICPGRVE